MCLVTTGQKLSHTQLLYLLTTTLTSLSDCERKFKVIFSLKTVQATISIASY